MVLTKRNSRGCNGTSAIGYLYSPSAYMEVLGEEWGRIDRGYE